MVRVFRCHRFVSQQVVSTASEPTVICSSGDRLFVACDNYLIEEFEMKTNGCQKVRQFYSIGRILEMVFSHSGDFLATIEDNNCNASSTKTSSDISFRVYSNLGALSNGNPMKVRISGQVTRAKARKMRNIVDTSQVVVVETPLKRVPTCIAVYAQNIAIAVKKTVLLYACETNTDMTQDIRCILELEFAFTVRKLELCEEFVMCSSGLECQIVQLNLDNSVKSMIDSKESLSSQMSVQSFFEHKALQSCLLSDDKCSLPKSAVCKNNCFGANTVDSNIHENHSVVTDTTVKEAVQPCVRCSTLEATAFNECVLTTACGNHDSRRTEVSAGRLDSNCSLKQLIVRQAPVSNCPSDPPSPPPLRRKTENKIKETAGGGQEILGPVAGDFHLCAVYVEYEGTKRGGSSRSGVLKNGVSTLLYKKLELYSHPIHSIQLYPVFIDEEVNSWTEASSDCLFLSEKRKKMIGLFSVVSTATYAYVYSLLSGDCRLISSFAYAIETLQVKLTESHLYALSESRLDVYTARCLSRIIFDAEETGREMQRTMLFISEEPCLIGYHTFFDLTAMSQTGDYLTLLSKCVSVSKSTIDSWSIYVLKRPEVTSLYTDMVDRAYELEKVHPENSPGESNSESLCLMREANMFLRSHLYLLPSSDKKRELIALLRKSCLYLAYFYQKHDAESHLAVPYYLMAGYSLTDIVRSVQDSKVQISSRFREALVWFARKLTDSCVTNELVSELEKVGIVNGCVKKLRAIASSNAF